MATNRNLLKHERESARRARKAAKAERMWARKRLKEQGWTPEEIAAWEGRHTDQQDVQP